MPRTTTKAKPRKPKTPKPVAVPDVDVLTLAEAASYLRLPEDEVLRLAYDEGLAGRPAGGDWRFLRSGLQDWLKSGPKRSSGKEALLAMSGLWEDDTNGYEFLRDIYRNRGMSDERFEELYGEFFPNRATVKTGRNG